MAPGWHAFSRYQWVAPLDMCASAVYTAIGRVWRRAEHDTASIAVRARDTLPPAARQIAERCGVPALLPPAVQQVVQGPGGWAVFVPAYQLALALHRDTETTALVKSMLAKFPWRGDQAGLLAFTLWPLDSGMAPVRPELIERDARLADSLSSLPVGADTFRVIFGHTPQEILVTTMGNIYEWLIKYRLRMGDTAAMRATVEEVIAACAKPLTDHPGLHKCNTDEGFRILRALAVLQHGLRSPEVVDLLTREARMTTGDPTARGRLTIDLLNLEGSFVWPASPYWFSATGAPLISAAPGGSGSSQSPAVPLPPNTVSLIWDPGPNEDHRLLGGTGYNFAQTARMLQKLMAKYGPQGLQLVIIAHNRGAAAGIGAVDLEQEVPAIRAFYQERLNLPAVVVVDTVPFHYLPDGRREDGYSAWERRYAIHWQPLGQWRRRTDKFHWAPPDHILVDRHGKIRVFVGSNWGSANDDPLLELFIQKYLQEP